MWVMCFLCWCRLADLGWLSADACLGRFAQARLPHLSACTRMHTHSLVIRTHSHTHFSSLVVKKTQTTRCNTCRHLGISSYRLGWGKKNSSMFCWFVRVFVCVCVCCCFFPRWVCVLIMTVCRTGPICVIDWNKHNLFWTNLSNKQTKQKKAMHVFLPDIKNNYLFKKKEREEAKHSLKEWTSPADVRQCYSNDFV